MREVAVILPIRDNKILLQLRDDKKGIDYPGLWGFFGGSIESGETPLQGAKRELLEEISYSADELVFLEQRKFFSCKNVISYAYYCELKIPLESLVLVEGSDFKLVTISEISTNKIYSCKLRGYFTLADCQYIHDVSTVALDKYSNKYRL